MSVKTTLKIAKPVDFIATAAVAGGICLIGAFAVSALQLSEYVYIAVGLLAGTVKLEFSK